MTEPKNKKRAEDPAVPAGLYTEEQLQAELAAARRMITADLEAAVPAAVDAFVAKVTGEYPDEELAPRELQARQLLLRVAKSMAAQEAPTDGGVCANCGHGARMVVPTEPTFVPPKEA